MLQNVTFCHQEKKKISILAGFFLYVKYIFIIFLSFNLNNALTEK